MWFNWLPWRFVIRYLAKSHGFIDPIMLLTLVRRFSQPAEVAEPIELLRAGVVMHARGLINSRAIQHNLDWVWPYWVERQFDPEDVAFIPRAFSLTHINLTHRNWTAVGVPGMEEYPIVDPAGLVTPFFDGWSLDTWVVLASGHVIAPSKLKKVAQRLDCEVGLEVITTWEAEGVAVTQRVDVVLGDGRPWCRVRLKASSEEEALLVAALRPYNPEGISFLHEVGMDQQDGALTVDGASMVHFDAPVDRYVFSDYSRGDLTSRLLDGEGGDGATCPVGMATGAALFSIPAQGFRTVALRVPLPEVARLSEETAAEGVWEADLRNRCELMLPYGRFQFLYEAALRTVALHAPSEVYAGPYTYKRFWFRDAAFIINAMMRTGLTTRVEHILDQFIHRQDRRGYFHSQEGEWDSNGQVLWLMGEHCRLTGQEPSPSWLPSIRSAARWIMSKRRSAIRTRKHHGLFPAGFSAEHLGPIDYYYWDDFWGVAGLHAAADMMRLVGAHEDARRFSEDGDDFMEKIGKSLAQAADRIGRPIMPAAPERRLDSGAIGSLAAGYPAKLVTPDDPRLMNTVDYLLDKCLVRGGFFQDMIHSGVNPYLTLHLAQVLLRANDKRYQGLTEAVADLASPTGQWPEAVHPRTSGGCMGDGQHVWAASEWLAMMRNCFVYEELGPDRLVLCAGVAPHWLPAGTSARFGPTATPWGPVSVSLERTDDGTDIAWEGNWRDAAPVVEIRLPGHPAVTARPEQSNIHLPMET